MTQKIMSFIILGCVFSSCGETEMSIPEAENSEALAWNVESLKDKAAQHLDSTRWDLQLFNQDKDTYASYPEVFQSFPLNKSPFPVAEYDYAVSSIPFVLEIDSSIFKGVRIGEYVDPESEEIHDKLTLLVLTNDREAEETTLVESRNYPYLTAQGIFKVENNEFDWVFSSSPDGYSTLLLNMKLFDLRFGETIIIYPQTDRSFLYHQIMDSPNNYERFEDFQQSIMNDQKVQRQLLSVNACSGQIKRNQINKPAKPTSHINY